MIKAFLELQEKYKNIFLVTVILVLLGGMVLASQLQIDPSFDNLISETGQFNTNKRMIENAYGQNDAAIILIKTRDNSILEDRAWEISEEEMGAYLADLKSILNQSQYATSVIGPTYSADGKNAKLIVGLKVPNVHTGYEKVQNELQALIYEAGTPPGVEVQITGLPFLLNMITNLLINDNIKAIFLTIVLLFLVIYGYFNDLKLTFATLAVPVMSLIFLAAVMVLIDIKLTITLAAVGVLMLGIGADYGIHLTVHYQELRKEGLSGTAAIYQTIQDLRLAIVASFLTTMAGFSALIMGVSPSSQAQGMVLALGIMVIYIVSVTCVPLIFFFFGKNISVKHNKAFDLITNKLIKLAVYQSRHPKTVLAIVGLITIVMFVGMSKVGFSTSNSNWIPDEEPLSEALREDEAIFRNTDTLHVIVKATEGDLRNVQTVRDIQKLQAVLSNIPHVDSVTSPFDGAELSRDSIIEVSEENKDAFDKDYTLTRVSITSEYFVQDEAGDAEIIVEADQILDTIPVHGAETSLFGDVIRFAELGDSLEKDTGVTTMIGIGLVFLIASTIYGTFVVGLIALFPIVVGIIWAVGLMGFFGVPFNSLSTGIVSLSLGIGADFSIHLVDGIRRFMRKAGTTIESAIRKTLMSAGSAILLASFTTLFGFLALTGATLLGTQRLGMALALAIISVFSVSIILVPAIMSIYLKRTIKQTR